MLSLFDIKFTNLNKGKTKEHKKLLPLSLPIEFHRLERYNFSGFEKYVDYSLLGFDMSGTWNSPVVQLHSNLYPDKNINSNNSIDTAM